MQVKIEDKSTVKKIIHIEISSEDVTAELDKAYKELGKSASIKGFRKGKIPRKVLETRFGKDVKADIISRLLQNSYLEIIKEKELENILGQPAVQEPLQELESGKPFNFSINIEVKPMISDIDFKGLELSKNMYKPSDEELDAQLQMIRENMATKQAVNEERPVKLSDFVLIDYQGFVDGSPFEHAPKIENYLMDIGTKNMPEEFSTKLTGAIPPQDVEIDIVYGIGDDVDKAFAGKTVTYKITLKEIQEKVLPDLDDTLAQRLGKFDTLEDVKNAICSNLEAGYKVRVHQELSEQVFTKILGKVEFELPDILLESELNAIVAETEQAYLQHNITLESVGINKDFIRTQYRDVAEKQARRRLLLGKIIEQEQLTLTENETEDIYTNMAQAINATVEQVKKIFNSENESTKYQLEYLKTIQLEKKAMEHIISNANVVEVEPVAESKDSTEDSKNVASDTNL
ncbi:MAG: trigger factor [Desulfamplus sp.]|nr:trigger factor [Desulfamplus sp.]